MQLPMTGLSVGLPCIPSTDVAHEIVKYAPGRIAWAKLVDDSPTGLKIVHVGTVEGKPAWADGFMLEIAEVPERLRALKKYAERAETPDGKPRIFDSLVPEITPQHVAVRPFATIVAEKESRKQFRKADVTYLAGDEREITIQTKYIDYFLARYPDAQFIMSTPSTPLVVKAKGKTIGVIMPIETSTEIMLQVRDFLRVGAPVEPPPRPPVEPVKIAREQIWEMDYNHTLDELKKMAREKGVSPSGTKHAIISRLLTVA